MPEQLLAKECWLSEYLDQWAYATAPSDLTFSASPSPTQLKRPDLYVDKGKSGFDVTFLGWIALLFVPRLMRRKVKA